MDSPPGLGSVRPARTCLLPVPHLCRHPEAHSPRGARWHLAISGTTGFLSKARQWNLTCSWCSLRAWLGNVVLQLMELTGCWVLNHALHEPGKLGIAMTIASLCLSSHTTGQSPHVQSSLASGKGSKPLWPFPGKTHPSSFFLEDGNIQLTPFKTLPLSSLAFYYSKGWNRTGVDAWGSWMALLSTWAVANAWKLLNQNPGLWAQNLFLLK